MIAARELHPPATVWLCAALAVAVHGVVLFAWRIVPEESPASLIEGDSVEVTLVESAPAAVAVPEPQPPVVPPEPVPPPEPSKKEPEMVLPEPKPTPTPPPRTATPPPKTTPQPARRTPAPRASAAGTGGASASAGVAVGGAIIGKGAKATYVIRPVASYPPESRAAGEYGLVILRLVVDGNGRPTSVIVSRSSGYPRLDRAAIEAGWHCRVRDAAPGSHLDAPVRFNLSDR